MQLRMVFFKDVFLFVRLLKFSSIVFDNLPSSIHDFFHPAAMAGDKNKYGVKNRKNIENKLLKDNLQFNAHLFPFGRQYLPVVSLEVGSIWNATLFN